MSSPHFKIYSGRLRVMHVIGSLSAGGAEHSLCGLVGSIDPRTVESSVVTLLAEGDLAGMLGQQGIPVTSLDMRRGQIDPRGVQRLAAHIRRTRPDLVVTWMYHANLIGSVAARWAGNFPVVWNIRNTMLDARRSKRLTRLVAWLGGRASGNWADRIVFVAHASLEHHARIGYDVRRAVVIPNGFDTQRFRPDPVCRTQLRRELNVAPSTTLVGVVGRFHADKDHGTFLDAAALVRARLPEVRFVLCGEGLTAGNSQLAAWIRKHRLEHSVHLLGYRADVHRVTAGLDVAVCSSRSEAFPRAVGEAMACGLPCVVTDVGDSARLAGRTGRIVAPGNHGALAGACLELLELDPLQRRRLGAIARQRVIDHFRMSDIAPRHVELWQELAAVRPVIRAFEPLPLRRAA